MLLLFLFVEHIDDTSVDMSETNSALLVKIQRQPLQTVEFLGEGSFLLPEAHAEVPLDASSRDRLVDVP